ncbi:MAG: 50S ribosomal protein L31e [Candidatus Micrarchaeota archaeon]
MNTRETKEKIYTVPLGKAYNYTRTKRTRKAVTILKKFIAKHSKVASKDVKISNALNSLLWKRSMQKPPRKIRIKILKEQGNITKAYVVDELIKKEEVGKEAGKKIDEKIEKKVEDKTGEKIEKKTEEKIEDKTNESKEKIEENLEENKA